MHRTHYLVWRRGFAPILFILAVALIVVAVGSGVYFALNKNTAQAPAPQDVPALSGTTSSSTISSLTPSSMETQSAASSSDIAAQKANTYFNCDAAEDTNQCLVQNLRTCIPAQGLLHESDTGLTIKLTVNGYMNDVCRYQGDMSVSKGPLAFLNGTTLRCAVPKKVLAMAVRSGGSMSQEYTMTYCTGTFVDIMRAQSGATQ